MWVIIEDQSLITVLRTIITNKGRVQFYQKQQLCFSVFLHLILISSKDVIRELLAEKIIG